MNVKAFCHSLIAFSLKTLLSFHPRNSESSQTATNLSSCLRKSNSERIAKILLWQSSPFAVSKMYGCLFDL